MLTSYYALAIVMLGCHCFLLSVGKETTKYLGKPEESHKLSHSQEGNRKRQSNSNHNFTWIQERGNLGLS